MSPDRTCFRNRIFSWANLEGQDEGEEGGIGPWHLPSMPFTGVSRSVLIPAWGP